MKVLLIDVNCKKGSTGKIVYDLYTVLRQEGHEAAVCYGRGPSVDEPGIFRFSGNVEICLHALLTRITGFTGCFSPVATRRLLRFMDSFKPDVVHIHELHAYFVNIAPVLEYLKRKNIKTVWTFHCEFMYTGKCGYAYDCDRWRHGCGNCPALREYPASLFFDFTTRMLHRKKRLFDGFDNVLITPVCDWLTGRAEQSPFLKEKRFQTVRNGIDLDVFYPRDTAKLRKALNLSDERILLHVTPDFSDERKGGRFILDLAGRLKEENVKIIIVGVSGILNECPGNVIAVNRTENQHRLAEYYSLADIFIITSEMECLPTVCLESLCCGTPVIGFDRGGTSETAPAPYGSFVPFGDMEKLENAVRAALDGESLAAPEQCAQFGKENYDRKKMTQKYMELYLRDIGIFGNCEPKRWGEAAWA